MTPLLWFCLGAVSGAFLGVVVMALVAVLSKADDDWIQVGKAADGTHDGDIFITRGGVPTRGGYRGSAPTTLIRPTSRGAGTPVRVRRGVYNWENE
jgi:hypothetical protein